MNSTHAQQPRILVVLPEVPQTKELVVYLERQGLVANIIARDFSRITLKNSGFEATSRDFR